MQTEFDKIGQQLADKAITLDAAIEMAQSISDLPASWREILNQIADHGDINMAGVVTQLDPADLVELGLEGKDVLTDDDDFTRDDGDFSSDDSSWGEDEESDGE